MRTRGLGLGSTTLQAGEYAQYELTITGAATASGPFSWALPLTANSTATSNATVTVASGDTPEQIANKFATLATFMNFNLSCVGAKVIAIASRSSKMAYIATPSIVSGGTGIVATSLIITNGRSESSDLYGYYGKYQGIITPNALITLAGITEGITKSDANNDPTANITWLKFSHNYKTLFVADRTIRHSISWGHLESKGLVFGKVVDIGGQKYLLRLLQGANVNPASVAGGANSNDEWDSLIAAFTPNTADSHWDGVDAVNASGGSATLCQETAASSITNMCYRGQSSVTYINTGNSKAATASVFSYRPVLEVL